MSYLYHLQDQRRHARIKIWRNSPMMTRSSRRARRHRSRSPLRHMRMLNSHQMLLNAQVQENIIEMMRIRSPMLMVTMNHRRWPRAWQTYRRQLYFDRRILLLTNVEMAAWWVGNSQLHRRHMITQPPMRRRAINAMKMASNATAKYRTRHHSDFHQSNAVKVRLTTTRIHGD